MVNINSVFPSKFLRADDIGDTPVLATINECYTDTIGDEQKLCLALAEFDKGLVLNKTNANNIASFCGPETDNWIGKKIVLISTMVDYQGKSVEAIRVRAPKTHTPQARATAAQAPAAKQEGPPPGHPAAQTFARDIDDEVPF